MLLLMINFKPKYTLYTGNCIAVGINELCGPQYELLVLLKEFTKCCILLKIKQPIYFYNTHRCKTKHVTFHSSCRIRWKNVELLFLLI